MGSGSVGGSMDDQCFLLSIPSALGIVYSTYLLPLHPFFVCQSECYFYYHRMLISRYDILDLVGTVASGEISRLYHISLCCVE